MFTDGIEARWRSRGPLAIGSFQLPLDNETEKVWLVRKVRSRGSSCKLLPIDVRQLFRLNVGPLLTTGKSGSLSAGPTRFALNALDRDDLAAFRAAFRDFDKRLEEWLPEVPEASRNQLHLGAISGGERWLFDP